MERSGKSRKAVLKAGRLARHLRAATLGRGVAVSWCVRAGRGFLPLVPPATQGVSLAGGLAAGQGGASDTPGVRTGTRGRRISGAA
jgi:hypothetical protein